MSGIKQKRAAQTEKAASIFIATLRLTGSVLKSAETCGLSRQHLYSRRDKDPDFAAAWDDALDIGVDDIEAVVRSKALDGSLSAARMILRAYKPALFGDKIEIQSKVDMSAEISAAEARVKGEH